MSFVLKDAGFVEIGKVKGKDAEEEIEADMEWLREWERA